MVRLSPFPDFNYLPDPTTSMSRLRRFAASTCAPGHHSRSNPPPKEGERYFALLKVEAVNYEEPDLAREKILFDNLTLSTPIPA